MPGFSVCAPRSTSDATVAGPGQDIELPHAKGVHARIRACGEEENGVSRLERNLSHVDMAPLFLVADAFMLGRRRIVEAFED